jgi:hypothetical protein
MEPGEATRLVDEAMKKAAVAWVAVDNGPAQALWCLPLDGALYLVSGPGEQPAPALVNAVTASPPASATASPPASATADPPASATASPPASATADPPASATAGNPASTAAGNPADPPANVAAGNPTSVAPSNPTSTAAGNPASVAPSNPTGTAAGNPASTAASNPTSVATGNPASVAPSNPTRGAAGTAAGASARVTVTLRGDHGGRIVTWVAIAERLDPAAEGWAAAVPQLAAKRLNAPGTADALAERWAAECTVIRLAPSSEPVEAGASLPDSSLAAEPRPTPATRRPANPFRLHRIRK